MSGRVYQQNEQLSGDVAVEGAAVLAGGGVFLDCLGDECVTLEGTTRNNFDALTRALNWPLAPQPPERIGSVPEKKAAIVSLADISRGRICAICSTWVKSWA